MNDKNRLIQIVLGEINNKKLIYEEELERVINDKDISIDKKILMIKKILKNISDINNMGMIWTGYTVETPNKQNNNS